MSGPDRKSADPPAAAAAAEGRIRLLRLLRQGIVFLILLALVGLFASQSDRFLDARNLSNILEQNAALVVVAVAVALTMITGGIDLSVGSVAAFAGALSAGLVVQLGWPPGLALPAALAVAAGMGAVNGVLVVRGGLPPFVATLAMLGIARGLTLLYTGGRPIGIARVEAYTFLGRGEVVLPGLGVAVATPVLIAALVVLLASLLLRYSRVGLQAYALGGSEETARLAGVPVQRIKVLAYASSGLLAGVAGLLLTARLYSAQPQVAVGLELEAIAAAVLGGVSLFGGIGTAWSAALGGLLIGVLGNGMNLLQIASYQQQMIQGAVLVAAVALDQLLRRQRTRVGN